MLFNGFLCLDDGYALMRVSFSVCVADGRTKVVKTVYRFKEVYINGNKAGHVQELWFPSYV